MTTEQMTAITRLYNFYVDSMRAAEPLMDSDNKKIAARGDEAFTKALAAQKAIAEVLAALDLELVVNDEDYAVDVITEY